MYIGGLKKQKIMDDKKVKSFVSCEGIVLAPLA